METPETPRLKLRQWNESDFTNFARYYADEDNARYVGGKKDVDQAWRHMALQIGHWKLRGFGSLVSYIDPRNAASIRLAKRLGAAYEGTVELASYGPHSVFRHY